MSEPGKTKWGEQSGCHPQKCSPTEWVGVDTAIISQTLGPKPVSWLPIPLPGHRGLDSVHLPSLLPFLFLRPWYKENLLCIQTPWPLWCSQEAQWGSTDFLPGACCISKASHFCLSPHRNAHEQFCCFLHSMERIKKTGRWEGLDRGVGVSQISSMFPCGLTPPCSTKDSSVTWKAQRRLHCSFTLPEKGYILEKCEFCIPGMMVGCT